MKLLAKFNLIFFVVFGLGFAGTAYTTRSLLQRNAQAEILERARLMMEKATAVRAYTADHVAPLLQTQMKYGFMPETVPAFSATEVLNALHKKYPEYDYKEATLNPTNLRNRAVEWEADIVARFRSSDGTSELVGERDTPAGPSLYVARPIRITQAACMQCHSTVDAAPRTMIDKYGSANGFGWKMNEVVGAQIVSVPMSVPLQRAQDASVLFLGMFTGVFGLVGAALNLMLYTLVVRPVVRLSAQADKVSMGQLDTPELVSARGDEVGVLTRSFTRMQRSVVQAMKMVA